MCEYVNTTRFFLKTEVGRVIVAISFVEAMLLLVAANIVVFKAVL